MALSATTTSADATHTHRTDKGSHLHPTATCGPDRTRTTCTAVARTTLHAASISSMRASSGLIRSRSLGSPLNLPFPSGSPAPAQAVTLAPVRHRNARRRAGQMGRGGCAGEDGLTSLAEAGQIRLVVIALPHVALVASTCDTSVPTVRAVVGKGMQLHEIYLRSPLAEVYIPLRQPERKIVSGERYTLMRKRGGQSLASIVASPRDCGHHPSAHCGCTNPTALSRAWRRTVE